jgi:hypothetical protein
MLLDLKNCGKTVTKDEIPKSKIDTQWVNTKPEIIYKDKLVPKEVILRDTFYKDVDTLSILKDYFATRVYNDTLLFENGTVSIKEKISENKIKDRKVELTAKQAVITKSEYFYEVPRNKYFIGGSIMINRNAVSNSFTVDGVMIPKNDRLLYRVGYDVINNNIVVGGAYKLRIKKEKEFIKN